MNGAHYVIRLKRLRRPWLTRRWTFTVYEENTQAVAQGARYRDKQKALDTASHMATGTYEVVNSV